MDRGAGQATVHGVARVRQDLVTKRYHPTYSPVFPKVRHLPSMIQPPGGEPQVKRK